MITSSVSPESDPSDAPRASVPSSRGLRLHVLNIAVIVLALTAMFWRVFFLGETLIDLRTLDNQLPWGAYAASSRDYPYDRRDLTDMYVTREYFVADAYSRGETPLWNPYTMAGHPIYADGVTRTRSPFLLFYKFFDVPLGYSLARIIELMLAGVFMYVFLACMGTSPRAGLIGSLVFVFSAHSMLHLSGLGWWGGLMWLPLILLFVHRAIRRGRFADAIVAGLFLGAQFYCGYMPNQIYYVGAIVAWCLLAAISKRKPALSYGRALAMLVVTVGIGFAVSAPEWAPVAELLAQSNRRIVPTEIGYVYLPPWYLATLVFPNLFGSAYDATALRIFTAVGVSHDHILYIGLAALAPLAFRLFFAKRTRGDKEAGPASSEKFFVILFIFSLVIMMAAPLYVHLTRFAPVLQTIRVIVRAGVLFIFSASALTAFGTDLLLSSNTESLARFARWSKRAALAVCVFVGAATVAAYPLRGFAFSVSAEGHGVVAFVRRALAFFVEQFAPPGADVLIPAALVIAMAVLIGALKKERLTRRAFYAVIVVLLLGDLFWTSRALNPTFERSRVFPQTEMTELIKSLPPGRVLVTPSDLDLNRRVADESKRRKIIAPPNTLLPYKIHTVAGKDQLFPKWYREYCSLIEPQSNLSHVVFDKTTSPYLDLLSVRYVLTHSEAEAPTGCRLIASSEGLSLFENSKALPRAFIAGAAIAVKSDADSLAAVGSSGFDPKSEVVLFSESIQEKAAPGVKGSAAIREEKLNSLAIEAESSDDSWLVLTDTYYPGWHAAVDGRSVEVLRANHTMRAVKLPAGRHMVSFEFAPKALRIANWMSLTVFGAAVVVLLLGWLGIGRRLVAEHSSPAVRRNEDR